MFNMYEEPIVIAQLIKYFSILNTFLIWFIPLYSLRVAYFFKEEQNIPLFTVIWTAGLITFINYLGFNIDLLFIIPTYLIVSFLCYKWITQKSIRWINISMLLFMLFIIITYAFFNYKLHYITYVFFSTNDILEYSFKFKPYFLIYHLNDFLGSVSFVINNKTIEYVNEPLQFRIYVFYYGLNVIGLLAWIFIYFDVLNKHQFKFDSKIFLRPKDEKNKYKQRFSNITNNGNPKNELEQKILDLNQELESVHYQLKEHRIFSSLRTIEDLRVFMEQHVYAVWDFMSLLKRLQNEICSTSVPWIPIKNGNAANLINSIVLGEESDKLPSNGHASHFELYIKAMKEIGADTNNIRKFISLLDEHKIEEAIAIIPLPAQNFVKETLLIAEKGTLSENLGSFFYGRENVIPDMFSSLLKKWSIDKNNAPMFHYYLVRHIELDADEHGPAAEKLISNLLKQDKELYIEMLNASILSVKSRIKFWDELYLLMLRK